MTHTLMVNNTEPEDYNIVFMMPRNDDILILGTFIDFDRWETDLTPDTPIMRKMREQCERVLPALKHARLDPDYPIAQGRRPVRKGDFGIEARAGNEWFFAESHRSCLWSWYWRVGFGLWFRCGSRLSDKADYKDEAVQGRVAECSGCQSFLRFT